MERDAQSSATTSRSRTARWPSIRRTAVLAELYHLAQALEKAGLHPECQHPRVKPPQAGAIFRVRLDCDGRVSSFETVTEPEKPGLWRLGESYSQNANSLPVMRFSQALLDIPQDD